MKKFCTKCSTENGITSQLEEEFEGVLVCKINPKHKFKIDGSGFIKSAD